ncbi:enoyl-coA hydratase/isomerase family protein [Caballeronia cordobensis]|nr:enoyl-coA hydratase/isomerase family protein [Burkholderia sp. RPE67]
MSSYVQSAMHGGVLELRIDRPASKNAITSDMYAQLASALQDADASDEVESIILMGGDGIFTAGNDIEDFVAFPPVTDDAPVWRFFRALMHVRQPVIAAVDGPAIGIGTTMLLHADFVFATPRSFFAMPFTSLGITPEGAASVLLPLLVGRVKAADLLLCGSRMSAEQAASWGLINAVVDADALRATAYDRARALAKLPADAVQRTKRLMKEGVEQWVMGQFASEQQSMVETVTSPAAKDAFARFLQRR